MKLQNGEKNICCKCLMIGRYHKFQSTGLDRSQPRRTKKGVGLPSPGLGDMAAPERS
jgi:hypothetical protein